MPSALLVHRSSTQPVDNPSESRIPVENLGENPGRSPEISSGSPNGEIMEKQSNSGKATRKSLSSGAARSRTGSLVG